MGRPIKLSDHLAAAADQAAQVADRSVPGQIEHWANLGRAVEQALTGHAVQLLKSSAGDPSALTSDAARKAAVLEGLQRALAPDGQAAVLGRIAARGPRYGTVPNNSSLLVRVAPDGRRTRGRMIDGDFIPEPYLPKGHTPARTRRKSRAEQG